MSLGAPQDSRMEDLFQTWHRNSGIWIKVSLVAQIVKKKKPACNAGDPHSIPGSGRFPWRREWLPNSVFLPGEFHGQRNLSAIVHGIQSIGHDWMTNQKQQETNTFAFGCSGGASGKEPAYQSWRLKRHRFYPCVGKIAWRREWQPTPVFLPGELWIEEPCGLQSMGSQKVRHNWSNLAWACTHAPKDS